MTHFRLSYTLGKAVGASKYVGVLEEPPWDCQWPSTPKH